MSRLIAFIIPARVVDRNPATVLVGMLGEQNEINRNRPIIPKGACPWRPLESHLDIHVFLVHIVEVS